MLYRWFVVRCPTNWCNHDKVEAAAASHPPPCTWFHVIFLDPQLSGYVTHGAATLTICVFPADGIWFKVQKTPFQCPNKHQKWQVYAIILSTGLGLLRNFLFWISLILHHFVCNKMLFLDIMTIGKTFRSLSACQRLATIWPQEPSSFWPPRGSCWARRSAVSVLVFFCFFFVVRLHSIWFLQLVPLYWFLSQIVK